VSIAASIGPSWRVWGAHLPGFFVTPKVYGIVNANHQVPRSAAPPGAIPNELTTRVRWNSDEVGLAVDLAFQWTFGPFLSGRS
jgi:hypothetical protein